MFLILLIQKNQGIQTMIHYPVPPHRQVAYPEFSDLSFPVTEVIHRDVLSLPISPVMHIDEVNQVITQLYSFHWESYDN